MSLGWIGHWYTLFVDDDPLWQELATTSSAQPFAFLEKNWNRIPVGLEIDVASNLRP